MDDVIFWVEVPETDGTTGRVELTSPMANALYETGLVELRGRGAYPEEPGYETGETEGADEFQLTVEWDSNVTSVTLGEVQVPATEAAAVIGLGFLKSMVDALEQVKAAQEDYL